MPTKIPDLETDPLAEPTYIAFPHNPEDLKILAQLKFNAIEIVYRTPYLIFVDYNSDSLRLYAEIYEDIFPDPLIWTKHFLFELYDVKL